MSGIWMSEVDRFFAKVRMDARTGCWEWIGAKFSNGYGHFTTGGAKLRRDRLAHRWLWQREHGLLERRLDIDHLCRNRSRVRFSHLEPVTRSVNLRRGHGVGGARQKRAS